jgi:hypothetical protein
MTTRIYFKPRGGIAPPSFERLGETGNGMWGLVADGDWIATGGGALELLYLGEAAYRHAMRRLPPEEVALAVEHRRETFWQPLPSQAMALVQEAMWACMDRTGEDERGFRLRAGLLTLHAKLACVDTFREDSTDEQLDWLFGEDCELILDLDCPYLQKVYPVDTDGKERAFRRQFLEEIIRLRKKRELRPQDRPRKAIYRGYAVKPVTDEILLMARRSTVSCQRWRDMMLMGLTDGGVAKVGPAHARLIYARSEDVVDTEGMTLAQIDVDISDRLVGPDLYPFFLSRRIGTASIREAARLLSPEHTEAHRLLTRQVEAELHGLARFRKAPPAKPTLDEVVAELLAQIDLLAALLLREQDPRESAAIKSVGRDVRKLLEDTR